MGIGDGDWGLGIGDWAQSPIPIIYNKFIFSYTIYLIINKIYIKI